MSHAAKNVMRINVALFSCLLLLDGLGGFLVTDAGASGYGSRVFRVNGTTLTSSLVRHRALTTNRLLPVHTPL